MTSTGPSHYDRRISPLAPSPGKVHAARRTGRGWWSPPFPRLARASHHYTAAPAKGTDAVQGFKTWTAAAPGIQRTHGEYGMVVYDRWSGSTLFRTGTSELPADRRECMVTCSSDLLCCSIVLQQKKTSHGLARLFCALKQPADASLSPHDAFKGP